MCDGVEFVFAFIAGHKEAGCDGYEGGDMYYGCVEPGKKRESHTLYSMVRDIFSGVLPKEASTEDSPD